MQLIIYKALQECGGSTIAPLFPLMLTLPGGNSLRLFMLGEFLSLNQGTKTVTQYLHAFNNLSQYAPNMVNTNAKKIASFKRGLNPKMMKHVGTNTRMGFNDFVSDCLKQEKNNNVYAASKTHKRAFESGPSQPRALMTNRSAYHLPAPDARSRPP
jgi:hypothetical protein